ncbi:hypothetical protein [Pseudonocardia sp.]|uniref:hypothetical protein n=1 Tax=Pseudonocardia sp. TaxID=60912 RepID=UPI002607ABD0|nr:hypothetical protein [Pseudonocardia sp.]
MTVVGADAVDAAVAAGVLAVGPRDVVTPLARERARERGVEIVVATPGARAAVTGDRPAPAPGRGSAATVAGPGPAGPPPAPVRPPSGALFRRGARLPPGTARGAARPDRTTARVARIAPDAVLVVVPDPLHLGLHVGRDGVREVVEVQLPPGELADLRASADRIRGRTPPSP